MFQLAYLAAAVLFILGLKQLSSPKGARRGNWMAAAGIVIALLTTFYILWPQFTPTGVALSAVAIVLGALIGAYGARSVKIPRCRRW